jgi:mannose-6-phosphate isomerase
LIHTDKALSNGFFPFDFGVYVPLVTLKNQVQNYAWGSTPPCLVSTFANIQGSHEPFAELWIGSHAKAPSKLLQANEESAYPSSPVLTKVLSVASALSIQVHPDKALGKKYHHLYPDIFLEAAPKPECGLTLSEFHALMGLRTQESLHLWKNQRNISTISEFPTLATVQESFVAGYRLWQSDRATYRSIIQKIYDLLLLKELSEHEALFMKCLHLYGDADPGLLALLYMDYRVLQPYESFSVPAGAPHAYVKGDLLECMTCSDNVIRGGLTPKAIHVDQLIEALGCQDWNIGIHANNQQQKKTFMHLNVPCGLFIWHLQEGEHLPAKEGAFYNIFIHKGELVYKNQAFEAPTVCFGRDLKTVLEVRAGLGGCVIFGSFTLN